MGNDEHGPAYPEPPKTPYRCPICHGDEFRYSECNHPGCYDGRDRGHPHARHIETYDGPAYAGQPLALTILGWVVALGLLVFAFWPTKAPAMDHGFNPDDKTVQWFERLPRPDYQGSCCGKGDAYPVSGYVENPDGSVDATIGDGSDKVYPDGYHRPYFPTGGVVHVEKRFVNKLEDDLDNPTDVSWIFMSVYAGEVGSVYCLIRHPSGN